MLARETHNDLRQRMRDNPKALFEQVAKETGATCGAVIGALPDAMLRLAPGSAFIAVMNEIASWGAMTFIVHTDDAIFEFSGPVPQGSEGRGYFNLGGRSGLHGHLRHDRCAQRAFVGRPFMGRGSASVLVVDQDGGIMFKVFVGRDENRELKVDQLARFRELAGRLSH